MSNRPGKSYQIEKMMIQGARMRVVFFALYLTLVLILGDKQIVLAADSSAQALYGKNLIVNGDAEAAPGTVGGSEIAKEIPGWTRTGNMDVVQYAHGDLRPNSPDPKVLGVNYFVGGPDSPRSTLTQAIDLSSIASELDKGAVSYTLSGYLGGFTDQEDNSMLSIQFEGADGKQLGSATIGPVTVADREKMTKILLRTATGKIPSGTRKAEVQLTITRVSGAYNDGYADNLTLILQH